MDNARLYEAAQREIASRERAEAELRETDQRKDEFLATLAHELRNPLAPIRQATMISMSSSASEEQKRWSHEVITRQVHHMSLLLDDLLDISRITRGTLELRTEMTDLASVVDAAVETSRPTIDAKHHKFSDRTSGAARDFRGRSAAARAGAVESADERREVHRSARHDPPARHRGRTERRDFGDRHRHRHHAGRALRGLHHVLAGEVHAGSLRRRPRHRARALQGRGGAAWRHDRGAKAPAPGHGSEFIVRIPRRTMATPAPETASVKTPVRAHKRRVLIADDNRDAAESLAMLLEMDGHVVTVVHDGQQALASIEASRPEVALLDIGMPEIDGYEVARRVRGDTRTRSMTLIAVTGWGQEADKARAAAAGFDLHFTKPIEPQRLIELLRTELPTR